MSSHARGFVQPRTAQEARAFVVRKNADARAERARLEKLSPPQRSAENSRRAAETIAAEAERRGVPPSTLVAEIRAATRSQRTAPAGKAKAPASRKPSPAIATDGSLRPAGGGAKPLPANVIDVTTILAERNRPRA